MLFLLLILTLIFFLQVYKVISSYIALHYIKNIFKNEKNNLRIGQYVNAKYECLQFLLLHIWNPTQINLIIQSKYHTMNIWWIKLNYILFWVISNEISEQWKSQCFIEIFMAKTRWWCGKFGVKYLIFIFRTNIFFILWVVHSVIQRLIDIVFLFIACFLPLKNTKYTK